MWDAFKQPIMIILTIFAVLSTITGAIFHSIEGESHASNWIEGIDLVIKGINFL
jgi:hypothetical protein